jgi:hypothetical protein
MTVKCPTCFAFLPHHPGKALCVGSCTPQQHPQATAVRGYPVRLKTVFDLPAQTSPDGPPASAACPSCGVQSSQEACGYCYGPVPARWRSAKVTCVAIAGARATGKSLMLAVAKEQLGLLVERFYMSTLTGVGGTDEHFRRHYTEPLYVQRSLLDATESALVEGSVIREPMIFQFTERHSDGRQRTRILVLRDVAGEDLEREGTDQALSFFSRADAVIALVDPLTVSQIRGMLADLIPGDTRTGGDGVAVVRRVLKLMTTGAPGARTSIPLAIALSKMDTLQRLVEVRNTQWAAIMARPGSPLQRDPSLSSPAYNHVDGDLLHEEVVGLLEELKATTLTPMLLDTADRFHYFAVSALGESPAGEMIHAGGIAPFRVLDPFKWVLDATA